MKEILDSYEDDVPFPNITTCNWCNTKFCYEYEDVKFYIHSKDASLENQYVVCPMCDMACTPTTRIYSHRDTTYHREDRVKEALRRISYMEAVQNEMLKISSDKRGDA